VMQCLGWFLARLLVAGIMLAPSRSHHIGSAAFVCDLIKDVTFNFCV